VGYIEGTIKKEDYIMDKERKNNADRTADGDADTLAPLTGEVVREEIVAQQGEPPVDLELVMKQLELYQAVIGRCIRFTQPDDWVLFGDNLYLQASGAEKFGNPFQIEISEPKVEKERFQKEGESHIRFTLSGMVFSHYFRRKMWIVAGRSSTDKFFFRWNKKTRQLEFKEPDELTVEKAAYSNYVASAVSRLLGLRNVKLEDLKAQGLKTGEVPRVDFKEEGAQPRGEPTQPPAKRRIQTEAASVEAVDKLMLLATEISQISGKSVETEIFEASAYSGQNLTIQRLRSGKASKQWVAYTAKQLADKKSSLEAGRATQQGDLLPRMVDNDVEDF